MLQTSPYFTQLLTMKQLNPNQKDELIEQYVNLLVDSMSMADLISYVSEDLTNFCD